MIHPPYWNSRKADNEFSRGWRGEIWDDGSGAKAYSGKIVGAKVTRIVNPNFVRESRNETQLPKLHHVQGAAGRGNR